MRDAISGVTRGLNRQTQGTGCTIRSPGMMCDDSVQRPLSHSMKRSVVTSICVALLAASSSAHAQSAENVAVVINDADASSRAIGEYYVKARGIPPSNVLHITTTADDTIERAAFVNAIQQPLAFALTRGNLMDRVLYLVLTKGVPLRIAGTSGQDGTVASVDSELTLLYRLIVGEQPLSRGRLDNPYFLGTRAIGEARPFTHRAHDIFLVSRLDGYTVEDATALIDRALAPVTEGRIVLDQARGPSNRLGDDWMAAAAQRLSAAGQAARVMLESSPDAAADVPQVLGYYSWGSTDPRSRGRQVGMRFVPGAIAATFVSTDARTFREPPATWAPAAIATVRTNLFAGTSHSLAGDLIRSGVTGVAGQVAEPYFESVIRPDVLFAAYVAGFNLVESFYLAMPSLSWQTVVVGDPLCTPFPRQAPAATDLDPPVDERTSLPGFFSERRIAFAGRELPGVPLKALVPWVKALTIMGRGDNTGARPYVEEAVAAFASFAPPRIALAQIEEADGNFDRAAVLYQQVLDADASNVVALNNLAYHLAVRKNQPKEGLALAQRAVSMASGSGVILDTLGWIEHLLGENLSASRRLAQAVKLTPDNAEIRLHAAIVYAANAARSLAEAELKEALRLRPALEDTPEVRDLRARLAALGPP